VAQPTAQMVTIASWNVEDLALSGSTVRMNSNGRTQQGFDRLLQVQMQIGADLFALQGISSGAALARVFPPSEFVLYVSGQGEADLKGFGPSYTAAGITDLRPAIHSDPYAPPADVPTNVTPGRYTAFAVRRTSPIKVITPKDVRSISGIDPT